MILIIRLVRALKCYSRSIMGINFAKREFSVLLIVSIEHRMCGKQ